MRRFGHPDCLGDEFIFRCVGAADYVFPRINTPRLPPTRATPFTPLGAGHNRGVEHDHQEQGGNLTDNVMGMTLKKRPSSAARLRAILDQAPLGIALTDSLTGRIQDVNASFVTITGRKRKDLLGLAWMDFTHPDDLRADLDQMARLIAGEIPYFQMDKRYLRPDGSEIWIGMTVAPVTEAGAPRRHISMIQDITAAKRMQEKLQMDLAANERQLRKILNNIPTPICVNTLGGDQRILFVNEQFVATFGYELEDIPTLDAWAERAYPDDHYRRISFDEWGQALAEARSGHGEISPREYRVTCKDGHVRDALISGRVQDDLLLVSLIDISALKQAQAVLRESEERFRKLFEDTRLATVLLEDGRYIAANQAALAMLRFDHLDQIIGLTPGDLSPALQPDGRSSVEKAADLMRLTRESGTQEAEWTLIRADGEHFIGHVTITQIPQGGKELLHITTLDITEQKKARDQLEFLVFRDALTGLPNREFGQTRLEQEVASASRHQASLAVLYLDLDKFKYINDTHGHRVGDLLLQGVALRLSQHLRAADTLCRLSADEFMMALLEVRSDHYLSQLASICERILASFAEPILIEGRQLFTSLSIGVAVYPQDGSDCESLMRHAHTALFEAKKSGQQSYRFFEPHMNDDLLRFVQICDALRMALERKEFVLHYQPQIDLRTGRVVGVEALIRWHRPGHGLVMPGAFIETAEESGLIIPIGRWVLAEACRQAAAWHAAGWHRLVMAVNLSAGQFHQPQLRQDVMNALDDSGLDPAFLDLELTESILLKNEQSVLDTVAYWKERHIQLSIDDFGTGYSSLAYLKRFKVDKLKIDRSFIINLFKNDEDRAIVLAMIQIARSLNLRTIAEGVEDTALAEQLRVMGCDEAQGYLYAKALPAADLEQWMEDTGHEP